ncbi:MAG: hypothetical protein QW114_03580, partial [Candidatus Nezhaarchaeales archaeon]
MPKARIVTYGTAGGAVKNYLIPGLVEVSVAEEDVKPKCVADVVISEIEEVLISDKLAGKLGIILNPFQLSSEVGLSRETTLSCLACMVMRSKKKIAKLASSAF